MKLVKSFSIVLGATSSSAAAAAAAVARDPSSTMNTPSSTSVAAAAAASSTVPTFALQELWTGHRSDELATVLRTTGILAVVPDETEIPSLTHHRETALDGLCHCQPALADSATSEGVVEQGPLIDDPQTWRTTVATATTGTTPLPLPQDKLSDLCGPETFQAMEALRDDVFVVTQAFVGALDRLLAGAPKPLLRHKYQGGYDTVSDIQGAANHLEHFHIYSKHQKQDQQDNREGEVRKTELQDPSTLQWHTDAGLFLAFVPARDCHDSSQVDDSFVLPNGQQAQFPPNAIVVMLGAGAQHWLQTGPLALQATRHAVQMQPGQVRAWYGMMSLIPEIALVQQKPERTFGDMKQHMSLSSRRNRRSLQRQAWSGEDDDARVSIGCGVEADISSFQGLPASLDRTTSPRRRMQHVQNAQACNNVTDFFCWMSCLDIPNAQNAQGYLTEGYSLYCMDPAIYVSSGNQVSKAVEACPTGEHNPDCLGVWAITAPNVPGYDLPRNTSAASTIDDDQFCYGGTSMYMDGFHFTDTTCVIYLFPEWVLSSKAKLAGAAIGTVVFGVALKAVIHFRRRTIGAMSMAPGYNRLLASATFYGLQLTMGYMLMLVIMTYSGVLFMCTILGLVFGHILFNSKDGCFGKRLEQKQDVQREKRGNLDATNTTAGSGGTRCHSQQNDGSDHEGVPSDEEKDTNSNLADGIVCNHHHDGNNTQESDFGIPEGATPCCQNAM